MNVTVSPQFVCIGETSVCDVEEHGETGVRKPVKVLNPQLPSREEIDEHELTHLPFAIGVSIALKFVGVLLTTSPMCVRMVFPSSTWTTGSSVRRARTRRQC